MIKKVLIAEDHESANISVQKTLEVRGIADTDYVYYCDDAITKILLALQQHDPYDLLITDLYFEADARAQKVPDGLSLIPAARKIQPDLKILVFSAESKAAVIEMLFDKLGIDGYVRKARNDAKELNAAMEMIAEHQRYFPRHLTQIIRQKNVYDFTEYDITIISLLADGMRQKDIPDYLQQNNIRPSGLSSIEKRLNTIKEVFEFSKNEQLVAFCKDMGII
ncbi:response regulator [Chitinophaga nivalis]|uniref:Response regulator n=1 Tax=Chitinophaga nivalis TaxID=2991709 RepID=A0ABT3IS91_9BACT|nr:response regulator [Chitinophaga nivalis]MCW3463458.1 response regulator [Chitinophaga nivalis]MCW3486852.1 response regulator [Chitinophaga nivalis]